MVLGKDPMNGTLEWNRQVWLTRLVLPRLASLGATTSIATSGGKAVLFASSVGTWEWDGVARDGEFRARFSG